MNNFDCDGLAYVTEPKWLDLAHSCHRCLGETPPGTIGQVEAHDGEIKRFYARVWANMPIADRLEILHG